MRQRGGRCGAEGGVAGLNSLQALNPELGALYFLDRKPTRGRQQGIGNPCRILVRGCHIMGRQAWALVLFDPDYFGVADEWH